MVCNKCNTPFKAEVSAYRWRISCECEYPQISFYETWIVDNEDTDTGCREEALEASNLNIDSTYELLYMIDDRRGESGLPPKPSGEKFEYTINDYHKHFLDSFYHGNNYILKDTTIIVPSQCNIVIDSYNMLVTRIVSGYALAQVFGFNASIDKFAILSEPWEATTDAFEFFLKKHKDTDKYKRCILYCNGPLTFKELWERS